jgi:hypothetical protein
MKQTSVEHIGRSQLIPGVLRTLRRRTTPTTEANGRMPTTDADYDAVYG